MRLTLFDALPETVLLRFAEAGHTLGVPPSDEVRLLELTHEGLLACLGTGCEQQFLGRRGCKM